MKRMLKVIARGVVAAGIVLVFGTSAWADEKSTAKQGSAPNGKPFQALQAQIDAVNEQVAEIQAQLTALDGRVTTAMADLQAQLNALAARVTSAETRVTAAEAGIANVADGVAALQTRVSSNEASIVALQGANTSLAATLADVQTRLATETSQIRGSLSALEASLLQLINTNTQNIQSLQGQVQGIQQFLANLSSYECQVGQAAKAVGPTGFLSCTTAGGGDSEYLILNWFYVSPNSAAFGDATCPTGTRLVNGGWEHWPILDYNSATDTDTFILYGLVQRIENYPLPFAPIPIPYYELRYEVQQAERTTYAPYEASRITRELTQGNIYSVAATNRTNYSTGSAYVSVVATCRVL